MRTFSFIYVAWSRSENCPYTLRPNSSGVLSFFIPFKSIASQIRDDDDDFLDGMILSYFADEEVFLHCKI